MAKVLKSGEALRGASPLHLGDLQAEAGRILAQARSAAQQILADAILQTEQAKRLAAEEGRKAGLVEGRVQGAEQGRKEAHAAAAKELAAKTATAVQALDRTLAALDAGKQDVVRRAHDEVVALAYHIAERILAAEVEHRPGLIRENVARAIELASDKAGLVVRLNPRDLETVREFLPALHRRFADLEPVELAADDSVGPGGAIVASRAGTVDATIRTQLEEIARALLGPTAEQDH